MEILFIVAFATYGMYSNTRAEFTGWGRRKLDSGRSKIAAKRAQFRPGGRYRSRTGRARLRDFPARSWWSFADVTWSFGRAVKTGAVAGAKDGRKRYRERVQPAATDQAQRLDELMAKADQPIPMCPGTRFGYGVFHPCSIPVDKPGDRCPDHLLDDDDPNGVRNCRTCSGTAVVDGQPCPDCLAVQQERNKQWDDELAQRRAARPAPIPVLAVPATAAAAATTGGTMTDAGSFEQVGAMLDDMKSAALFALEDAQNDLKRAQEDASSTEAMVAFSQSITAGPSYEQPLARTGETSGAMTKAKEDAVAAAEAHVAAIEDALVANARMME